jgi:hypothetical protein
VPGEQRRPVRRREVGSLGEVLVGCHEPGERTGIVATRQDVVDLAGPSPGDLGIEGDDRVDARVDRLDPGQVGVEQLGGRHLPPADEAPLLDRAEIHELHGAHRRRSGDSHIWAEIVSPGDLGGNRRTC